MATTTINSITLEYPDNPCMVFNPCPLKVSGTLAAIQVFINTGLLSYNFTFDTPNGGVIDVQEYLQSFFDGLKLGDDIDYSQANKVSELGKTVNFTVKALDGAGVTLAQFNLSVFCIWAAMRPAEDYTVHRKIMRWDGYPLTVGVYGSYAGGGTISIDDYYGNNDDSVTVNAEGLFNTLVDLVPTGNRIDVEYIFIRMGVRIKVPLYTIECINTCFREGIYLRWIDRRGMWCYWMFKRGDESIAADGKGLFRRNDLDYYYRRYQWHGNSGRRQNYTRNDVVAVCAPLVDRDTFDFLQDVTTSPAVDMYIKNAGVWAPVTIEAGTYTKDHHKPLQDFVMNVVLPETLIQQL